MRRRWVLALALLCVAAGCGSGGGKGDDTDAVRRGADRVTTSQAVPTTSPAPERASLVAVGDIAVCGTEHDEATAALAASLPGPVLTLGDTVYPAGTADELRRCFEPSWGSLRSRIRPAPGNHDYLTADAKPYYDYFGPAAGPSGRGYYSWDVGGWHLISLNSNCAAAGGCGTGSPQLTWLDNDLAQHDAPCTLAYWHHPRFSSGPHGPTADVAPLWAALHEHGADIVLAGHDHDYERLAPADATGAPDARRGIRSFVVGTGGATPYHFASILPISESRADAVFGVLALTLRTGAYNWRFVPVAGETFADSGHGSCH